MQHRASEQSRGETQNQGSRAFGRQVLSGNPVSSAGAQYGTRAVLRRRDPLAARQQPRAAEPRAGALQPDRTARTARPGRGRSIIEFFGGGKRGWVLYVLLVLPVIAVLLVFDAIARLILPEDRPVWMFRRKRTAAIYLLAVGLALLLLFALAGACGRARAGSRPAGPPASAAASPTAPPAEGAAAAQAQPGQPVAQAAAPAQPAEGAQPALAPVVVVTPPPEGEGSGRRVVRVANTGGAGVYLRRSPQLAERLRAWVDGTELEVLEEGPRIGDELWLKVRDPAGNTGYVPARYTAPVQ